MFHMNMRVLLYAYFVWPGLEIMQIFVNLRQCETCTCFVRMYLVRQIVCLDSVCIRLVVFG